MNRRALLAVSFYAICGSSLVQAAHAEQRLPKPERVIVDDFAVAPEDVLLNQGRLARLQRNRPRIFDIFGQSSPDAERLKAGRQAADALARRLVERLTALGLPAERAAVGSPVPPGSIAVEGQFVTVDEGNRAQRVTIGFGLGRSEVMTEVQLYYGTDNEPQLLRNLETKIQSSAKPGAAVTMGAGAAVGVGSAALSGGLGAAGELGATVEADARRTADEIVKQLTPLFVAQGWIAPQ
jgi:hypothetical protein